MANINNHSGTLNTSKRRPLLILLIVIFVLIVGVILYQQNHHKSYRGITAEEQRSADFDKQTLKQKDYANYQLQLASYANNYTTQKKYDQTQRLLDQILKNVPQDKLTSDTYRSFWYLYQQNGDAQNRKKYALLVAEKLKAEGQPEAAAAFEKDAQGTK